MTTITILGSYHGHNTGDDAILASIISEFKSINGSIEFRVPTTRPELIKGNFDAKPIPVGEKRVLSIIKRLSFNMLGVPTFLSIYKSDIVIITQAILFDMKLFSPWFNYLFSLTVLVPFSRFFKKPVVCYNVGVGPVKTKFGAFLVKNILDKTNLITLRQKDSLEIINRLNVEKSKVFLGADPALNNVPIPSEQVHKIFNNINFNKSLVGLNINVYLDQWDGEKITYSEFVKIMSNVGDYIIEEFNCELILIVTNWMDESITEEVSKNMKNKSLIIYNKTYNHKEIMGLLGQLDMFIGTRLHSLILAASMYTPIIAINYLPKVKDFMNRIKQEDKIIYFDNFTEQAFKQKINEVWDNRLEIRKELKGDVNKLKSRIRRTTEMTLALLDR